MDKILFVVPPNIQFDEFVNPPDNVKTVSKASGTFGSVITDIPLGALSLSAYVKQIAATQTRLLDFNVEINKLDRFEYGSFVEFYCSALTGPILKDFTPGIIAISALFTPTYYNMLDIARCCREIFPGALNVAGGGVPTNMYREIFRDCDCFDALCYGEGERFLAGLVKADDKQQYLEQCPSGITKAKVENGQLFQHDFIVELDEIPFYDYDLLDTSGYGLNPTISAYTSVQEKMNSVPVMTSRGCTHYCCFCSSHTVHGRSMRYHSLNRIRNDLQLLKDRYNVKTIVFQDDHFMSDKQRAYEIVEMLREFRLTAFFPNSLALYALDRSMLEALKSVGVNQLVLSVESGSNRVLREVMRKPLNLEIVKQVTDDCRDLGIYSDVNILIGLPGETKQDIEDTRTFLRSVHANWFRINVATPLVGSEMFAVCVENKYLKGSYIDCNYKKAVVETEDFTVDYIQEVAYVMNLELNFIANGDFRAGNFQTALNGFENAIRAKHDHAIAHYCAARCYEKLCDFDKAQQYTSEANRIVAEIPYWRNFFDLFKIAL
ncbi:MAG: radical SAM protein [Desulfuromonadales bacterium]